MAELNRQLDPLLASSKLRDLEDDELDRMIRISTATIAIHRQLSEPGASPDMGDVSTADLKRMAARRK